jgi:VanZ family protein
LKFLKYWLPAIIWCIVIFILSSIPSLHSNFKWDFTLRKIAHVIEYLILTALFYWALKKSFNLKEIYLYLLPFLISLLYATTDEYHQTFVPGRFGTKFDVMVDLFGVLLFYIILFMFRKNKTSPD